MENVLRILEEIKSSDVVENRVQLLTHLEQLDLADKSELPSLVECLALWEDFTCLDVSQCMLNKSILRVASKYLDLDLPGCSLQFLGVGTKASQWCAKHLTMSLMSMEESQEEEHSNIFFQLLLDCFRFSASSFTALTKHSAINDEASVSTVHKFVSEQLNLIKEVTSNAKKVDSFSSEILKAAQVVINSVVRLCKEYIQAVNQDINEIGIKGNEEKKRMEEVRTLNNFLSVTALAVKTLSELGVLAAKDGGSLVTILNASWKGVITLLQIEKQALAPKVEIAEIILKLISLVKESLRFAAESWSGSLKEIISATEARRTFLPAKFFLVNVVKVVSLFPNQACVVYKDIALCILTISAFKFSLSQQTHCKSASEVMTDLLEKTSIDLLCALLNSGEVKYELKRALLDWFFMDEEGFVDQACKDQGRDSRTTSLADIFSLLVESAESARILLLGRVALFQSVLRYSPELGEGAKLAITTKLQWFLDTLIDEEVYSSVLSSQIPMTDGSGKTIVWEPMFSALLLSLKTLMISVSSNPAWAELETFLLRNFLHPHFICWQILMEIWCFWTRHAAEESVNDMVDKLCALMMSLSSSEAAILPDSALRRTARSVCFLLNHGAKLLADWVYKSVLSDSRSQLAADVYLALLLEGFPLNLLSDSIKNKAKQQIIADYFNFIENFNGKRSIASRYSVFGAPVFALSACLQILQMSITEIDTKTLKFLTTLLHNYTNPEDKAMKDHYLNILSETLSIISNIHKLYSSQEMDNIILELQKIFISPEPDDLRKCKPNLALFMAGLSHTEMSETDNCSKSRAVWDLFHMLLRERHWALVHTAVSAFGYFCARTSCNQLWRFVPHDASLAYDLASGKNPNTELFMSELKTFLEKEQALLTTTPSPEQLRLLLKEGMVLKEMMRKLLEGRGRTKIEGKNRSNKKRKLPEGISRGVELLQNGVKAIGDGLCSWRSDEMNCEEFHNKFLNHFSCLEDLVSHLVGLAGSD